MRQKFKDRFGHDPKCYVRSPGRVNIIGQSTLDYSNNVEGHMISVITEDSIDPSPLLKLGEDDKRK